MLQLTPARWVDAIGDFLGRVCWHFMRDRRLTVERNCRIAYELLPASPEIVKLSKSIFRSAGANLLGGMKTATMCDQQISQHVTVLGLDSLSQHFDQSKRGAILALAHMGNWEILARMNPHLAPDRESAAFFRPLNNPLMNQLVAKRRARSGTALFSNKDGFTKASTHLRGGGLLGILADQHAGRSGVVTPFFGRNTSCTPLLEIMHRRTGAAIFHVSVIRTAPAHWTIELRAHNKSATTDTASLVQGLEKSILRSPNDVFWFHNRWKIPQKRPFDLRQSRSSALSQQQRCPWQVIIILSANPSIRLASLPAIEKLVQQEQGYHFIILSAENTFHASNAEWVTPPPQFEVCRFLNQLDSARSTPIDLVIFFTAENEHFFVQKCSRIPWSAGYSAKKSHNLSIKIPYPISALDSEETWNHFIEALGCSSA